MRHYKLTERIALTPAGKQALAEVREAEAQARQDEETRRVFTRLAREDPAIAEVLKPVEKPTNKGRGEKDV